MVVDPWNARFGFPVNLCGEEGIVFPLAVKGDKDLPALCLAAFHDVVLEGGILDTAVNTENPFKRNEMNRPSVSNPSVEPGRSPRAPGTDPAFVSDCGIILSFSPPC